MVDNKVTYFAIKVNSVDKDLILIKGNDNECDPIVVEGTIKLSINQNIHIKKVKLSLIGELSVNYFERDKSGSVTQQVLEKYVSLKVDWDNLLIDNEGDILIGKYGDKPIKSTKINSLAHHKLIERPNFDRTKSQPNLSNLAQETNGSTIKLPDSGLDGTPFKNCSSKHSFLLPQGNYSLPFKVVLPTNTCETVEGLSVGKLLYKFECSIQKGVFDKPLIRTRYLRLIRTLYPTNLNLVEDVDITNTWPGKVDYKVFLNKKGVAIGSTIPIRVLIVPLIKGLKLKRITAEIVEHFHVNYLEGKTPEFEQIFGHQQVMGKINEDDGQYADKWDLSCSFKVPDNLKEITQTCTLANDLIQVRHRIRVVIQIKNPSGHLSELRANLPITLYISSNIGHVYGHRYEIDPHYGVFNVVKNKQDALFKRDKLFSGANTPLVSPSISPIHTPMITPGVSPSLLPASIDDNLEEDELENLMAPPLYEQAIKDKIFDITSAKSPIEQLGTSYFDLPRTITPNQSSLDLSLLAHLPTYVEAEEEDDDANELAPKYDNSSGINSGSSSYSSLPFNLEKNPSSSSLSQSLSQSFKPNHSRSSSHLKLSFRKKP